MRSVNRCWWVLGLFAAAAVAGCSGTSNPPPEKMTTVPVSGRVTYRGKPVGDVTVIFQSIDGKASATGTTDASGTFRLSTYAQNDGAPVGLYKVMIAPGGAPKEIEPGVLAPLPEEGVGGGGPKSPVPAKYTDPGQTDLTADVKEEASNQFSFDLK